MIGRDSPRRLLALGVALAATLGGSGCASAHGSALDRAGDDGVYLGIALGAPVAVAALPITGPLALAMDGLDDKLVVLLAPAIPTGLLGLGLGTALALPVEALRPRERWPKEPPELPPELAGPLATLEPLPAPEARAPPVNGDDAAPTGPELPAPLPHPEEGPCPLCGRPEWHLPPVEEEAR